MSRPRRKDGSGRCPICGRPREETFKPFCSKRCADIDLARWLEGGYTIPGRHTDDGECEPPPENQDDD